MKFATFCRTCLCVPLLMLTSCPDPRGCENRELDIVSTIHGLASDPANASWPFDLTTLFQCPPSTRMFSNVALAPASGAPVLYVYPDLSTSSAPREPFEAFFKDKHIDTSPQAVFQVLNTATGRKRDKNQEAAKAAVEQYLRNLGQEPRSAVAPSAPGNPDDTWVLMLGRDSTAADVAGLGCTYGAKKTHIYSTSRDLAAAIQTTVCTGLKSVPDGGSVPAAVIHLLVFGPDAQISKCAIDPKDLPPADVEPAPGPHNSSRATAPAAPKPIQKPPEILPPPSVLMPPVNKPPSSGRPIGGGAPPVTPSPAPTTPIPPKTKMTNP